MKSMKRTAEEPHAVEEGLGLYLRVPLAIMLSVGIVVVTLRLMKWSFAEILEGFVASFVATIVFYIALGWLVCAISRRRERATTGTAAERRAGRTRDVDRTERDGGE
jgi:hypothetical protein